MLPIKKLKYRRSGSVLRQQQLLRGRDKFQIQVDLDPKSLLFQLFHTDFELSKDWNVTQLFPLNCTFIIAYV